MQAILNALGNGSKTLAVAELKFRAQCNDSDARVWIEHGLSCLHAWPLSDRDREVLRLIDQTFQDIEKPEHFTDYLHCDECHEHDVTLCARTRDTLRREDLGNSGWDPMCFCSEVGIGYYFPSLSRFALLPDIWRFHDWYCYQLLWHLSYKGSGNRFLAWCSPIQREAVCTLLEHIRDTRLSEAEDAELREALTSWRPHGS